MSKPNDSLVALPQASTEQNDSMLRLRRAVESFQINERAKESIAHSQLSQFHDLFCGRLRQNLSLIEAKIALAKEQQTAQSSSPETSGLLGMFQSSPWQLGGTGAAAAMAMSAMAMNGQSWILQSLSMKSTLMMAGLAVGQSKLSQVLQNQSQALMENIISQFSDGADTTRHSEAQIKQVAKVLSLRYIDQVVPLNKDSQVVLAEIMCSRIMRHLQLSSKGYELESRKPLVAKVQRQWWQLEAKYHQIMTPPDRVPVKRALDLTSRCIRALTAESNETDDKPLHFEAWFSPTNASATLVKWTTVGVLCQTGLKIKLDEGEVLYAHEFSDTNTYGFAYGDLAEANEREMSKVSLPTVVVGEQDIKSKL
ncbi:hypothetical protein BASA81_000069 [Batrachochytrium salamandrivorans]|nr:hypothetical protein BASA81_000069 [Batrachochytrium salamandrivorans]